MHSFWFCLRKVDSAILQSSEVSTWSCYLHLWRAEHSPVQPQQETGKTDPTYNTTSWTMHPHFVLVYDDQGCNSPFFIEISWESCEPAHDMPMMVHMAFGLGICIMERILSMPRVHPGTYNMLEPMEVLKGIPKILKKMDILECFYPPHISYI